MFFAFTVLSVKTSSSPSSYVVHQSTPLLTSGEGTKLFALLSCDDEGDDYFSFCSFSDLLGHIYIYIINEAVLPNCSNKNDAIFTASSITLGAPFISSELTRLL